MRPSSTLRIAVDSIECLNLGSARLKAFPAFFIVGFGVGRDASALQRACGRRDDAEHAGTQKLTSPDGCFAPIAHQNSPWSTDNVVTPSERETLERSRIGRTPLVAAELILPMMVCRVSLLGILKGRKG